MTNAFLPYGRQCIDDDDIAAVAAVLKSDFLTTGPTVAAFERTLSDITSAEYAVACSSGTAALHLAALALDLKPGDAAIVPSITFLATANAARYVDAEVLFADVNPRTGLMEANHIYDALARAGDLKVKAVIPVHLAGQAPDMASLNGAAEELSLELVEDACHSIGGRAGTGQSAEQVGACTHSSMSVFSFHPVKTITMGEGGAVTTNSARLAEALYSMRNHGMTRDPSKFSNLAGGFDSAGTPNPWYYEMHEPGFNYRASDIQCALGNSQLKKLDGFIEKRRFLAACYDELLQPIRDKVSPVQRVPHCCPAWHLYPVQIDFDSLGLERSWLMNGLKEQGIGTQVHYIPVHLQPYYKERYGDVSLPGAEAYYARTLSLPLFPAMEKEDVARVTETLSTILANV